MKVIVDANISWRIVKFIASYFTECMHADNLPIAQPAKDSEIWMYANEHKFHIITFDADFTKFTKNKGLQSKIILLKTGNISTAELSDKILSNTLSIETFILSNDKFILELY